MIRAILDTNVILQGLIGSSRSSSVKTLGAYAEGRFHTVFSPDTFDEVFEVLCVPTLRKLHGLSGDEIRQFMDFLLIDAEIVYAGSEAPLGELRDLSDRKLLTLALESQPDFLVTNDHRHLLPLRTCGKTPIVTPRQFLEELA